MTRFGASWSWPTNLREDKFFSTVIKSHYQALLIRTWTSNPFNGRCRSMRPNDQSPMLCPAKSCSRYECRNFWILVVGDLRVEQRLSSLSWVTVCDAYIGHQNDASIQVGLVPKAAFVYHGSLMPNNSLFNWCRNLRNNVSDSTRLYLDMLWAIYEDGWGFLQVRQSPGCYAATSNRLYPFYSSLYLGKLWLCRTILLR